MRSPLARFAPRTHFLDIGLFLRPTAAMPPLPLFRMDATAGVNGRVAISKPGATLTYAGRAFRSLKGAGYKANYQDIETGAHFWISGPRQDGADGLYGRITQASDVDEDVAEAYWRDIRGRGTRTGDG